MGTTLASFQPHGKTLLPKNVKKFEVNGLIFYNVIRKVPLDI